MGNECLFVMFVMRITFFSSSHPCKLTSLIPLLVPDKLTSVIATLPPSDAMTMRREKGRIVEARFIKCIDSHKRPMESKTLMDCIQSHSLHRLFIHSFIHSFIVSLTHSFIHSFIHSLFHSLNNDNN